MALSKVNPNFVSQLGRRNLIINGAMQVWQRGTSFTGVNSLSYHTDRFQSYNSNNASGVSTISKSTDAPAGFGNSYKLEVTTAEASLHANAEYGLYYYFEGQDLQGLKKGTSDAKSLTASFWAKSSVTGTFIVEIMDNDNSNRHINKSYTINTANTWEYKTITFEGDTVGALDNDTNNSFHINFWLGGGTAFTGGTLQTSWGTLDQSNRATGQTNVHATVGNTWQITGVQLEVGDTATDFEHRSFGEEFAACQRYFYLMGSGTVFASAQSGSGAYTRMYAQPARHPVAMRADPSFSFVTGGSSYFVSGGGITVGTPTGDAGTVQNSVHTFYSLNTTKTGFNRLSIGAGFTFTRGQSYGNTSDFIEVSAEL